MMQKPRDVTLLWVVGLLRFIQIPTSIAEKLIIFFACAP